MSDTPATPADGAPVIAPEVKSLFEGIQAMQKEQARIADVIGGLSKTGTGGNGTAGDPSRSVGPFAQSGESASTSRGFQFSRVVGVCCGKMPKEMAKVEMDLCARTQQQYVDRGFYRKEFNGSVVVPLGSELIMQGDPSMEGFAKEVAQVVGAGVHGADPDEMLRVRQKSFGRTRGLSWQDEQGLGALVPPPQFGEPIELLRNQEVFLKAGAKVIPFPPSGRVTWPRFTGATTAYAVGSGEQDRTITASSPTTGDVVLSVKKIGVLCKIPNELFRFPTVSVEQVIRADMMKSASLYMDKTFLEGTGSETQTKGLINYANISSFTAGLVAANGNTFQPEDVLKMIGTVEENNIDFDSWIMRPLMYGALHNRRADAVSPSDGKGMFLFNVLREWQERYGDVQNNAMGSLDGYRVFKTNQVSKVRTKGTASNLSYILGGNFHEYLVALSGVMEFMVTAVGDTPFQTDQTWIRAIMWCDAAPRHEEAFILCDSLVVA